MKTGIADDLGCVFYVLCGNGRDLAGKIDKKGVGLTGPAN